MPFDYTITDEEITAIMEAQDLSYPKALYIIRRQKVRQAIEEAEDFEDLRCVIRKMLEWTL